MDFCNKMASVLSFFFLTVDLIRINLILEKLKI